MKNHTSAVADSNSQNVTLCAQTAAGWEGVMRVRCSKGLSISQFHGHFFVRSIDLLSLPQVSHPVLQLLCALHRPPLPAPG